MPSLPIMIFELFDAGQKFGIVNIHGKLKPLSNLGKVLSEGPQKRIGGLQWGVDKERTAVELGRRGQSDGSA